MSKPIIGVMPLWDDDKESMWMLPGYFDGIKHAGGIPVGNCDAYINVIGGLTLDEPAADLATALAIASSYLDRPLGADLAAIGEIGLSGEIRSVSMINHRLTEISRLGFRRCVIPSHVRDELRVPEGLELIPVRNIAEAVRAVLGKKSES